MDCTEEQVAEVARMWGASTDVRVTSALTIEVRSHNRQWIEENVVADPDIAMVDFLGLERSRT